MNSWRRRSVYGRGFVFTGREHANLRRHETLTTIRGSEASWSKRYKTALSRTACSSSGASITCIVLKRE